MNDGFWFVMWAIEAAKQSGSSPSPSGASYWDRVGGVAIFLVVCLVIAACDFFRYRKTPGNESRVER